MVKRYMISSMLLTITILLMSRFLIVYNMMDWPNDNYGIPKPASGCPKGIQDEFDFILWPEGKYKLSTTSNIVFRASKDQLSMKVCYKHNPVVSSFANFNSGSFCLIKIDSKDCTSKFVEFKIDFMGSKNNHIHSMTFCCRNDRITKSESFPYRGPFYLIRNKGQCQEAHMYKIQEVDIGVKLDGISKLAISTTGPSSFAPDIAVNLESKSFNLVLCYYYIYDSEKLKINNQKDENKKDSNEKNNQNEKNDLNIHQGEVDKVDQIDKNFQNFENEMNNQKNPDGKIDPINQNFVQDQIDKVMEAAKKEEQEKKEKEAKAKRDHTLKIVGFTFLGIVLFAILVTGIIFFMKHKKIGPFKK